MPPAASEASDPALPASFGKYFLTEKLATGGMAEIYLAKLIGPGGFEKPLVIKQIHPRLSGQRPFVDLFVAEAKILVTLAHGNIVPVYELGVVDDVYFIAMEYIDGPTLYRLTEALARRDGVMPPPVAAWIAARVLEGLDYAHRKGEGVIHRDLSPRNVMLSRDGEVKLVDFGIALTADSAGDGGGDAPTGSFPYMSPEQVRREALTVQTDLFSVGVLLWEMLVGQRLFARGDADATLAAVEGATIERPSVLRPDVPARLDDVVMRALERDRSARWESAGDMLAALQRYLYALEETPGPRDVAALVARYCPPETRRMPTHAEALALGGDDVRRAASEADGREEPGAGGPRTSVLPRPDAAGGDVPATPTLPAGGRRKRAPTRQQSFATHVALDELLGAPADAETGADAPRADDGAGDAIVTTVANASGSGTRAAAATDESTAATAETAETAAATAQPRPQRPANVPPPPEERYRGDGPGVSGLALAAFGALALGGAAIYVFVQGRAAVMAPDAMPRLDAADYGVPDVAAPPPIDAAAPTGAIDAPSARTDDASSARTDAASSARTDAAAGLAAADAGRHVPAAGADAAVAVASVDAAAAVLATGSATLKLGADPWGDIEVDGAPRGRTPAELTVSAGHHSIAIIFRGDDPPQTKTFAIDLGAGEVRSLQASFTPH